MEANIARPNQRDTMFRNLFKTPSRFIPLLEKCRGEKVNLSENEITPFDLDTDYATRPRRNDISFMAEGKIIILVEHQSTVNPNMALRLFLYYNELLQLWIKLNNINLYGKEKVKNIPQPEFYVVYDGKESLKEEYSTFQTRHKGIKIDIKVKIVDIHYDRLDDTAPQNALAGYACFWHEHNEGIKQGLPKQESFEAARQTCIKKGYLSGYIDREEFIMFYKDFLNYDNQVKAEVREAALAEVKAEVREEALAEGKAEGATKVIELIKSGLTPDEALRKITEESAA